MQYHRKESDKNTSRPFVYICIERVISRFSRSVDICKMKTTMSKILFVYISGLISKYNNVYIKTKSPSMVITEYSLLQYDHISKAAVSQVHFWNYCSLALNHRYKVNTLRMFSPVRCQLVCFFFPCLLSRAILHPYQM